MLLLLAGLAPLLVQAETLAEVFDLARQNDAIIRSQEATYKANTETRNIARSALLPQVRLNASKSETDIDEELPAPGVDYDVDADKANVTASQTLFNLEYWHNYQSGKEVANRAEAQFRSDQQELIVRVVNAYTEVLAAIDRYNTAKAEEAAFARQLDQTKQRFDVGLVAITDVLEAQASFDSAAVNVLNSRGAVGIAFEALDTIAGTRINSVAPLSEEYVIKNPEPFEREEWVNKALANNAELKASEFAREAALENAKAKRAAHFPTVSAAWQHNDNEVDSDPAQTGIDSDQENDVLAFNFQMPLFAGGGISATRRQAWEQYNAANEQYIYAYRSTTQAARSYHLAVVTGVARVNAQKQALISAQSALDATNAGYDAGTRNIVDVLNAQRALYNAQRLWFAARYQFITDRLRLQKVSGELDPSAIELSNQFLMADKQIARSEFAQ